MTLLAVQKLKDLYSFTNSFITYDLLAMRWLRYGYIYPFVEAYAGIVWLPSYRRWQLLLFVIYWNSRGYFRFQSGLYRQTRIEMCVCRRR